MIKRFVAAYFERAPELRACFALAHPKSYKELVLAVVRILDVEDGPSPDPDRVYEIDDGSYQGTLIYLIGEKGRNPRTYWFCRIQYGSCSWCDTLQAIRRYSDDPPTPGQTADYLQLALHIVQGLKELREEDVLDE